MKKLIPFALILFYGNTKACSYYDPDYDYFNLFTQSIIKDKSYLPFLMTSSNRFYGHEHYVIPNESIENWQSYFGKKLNYTETLNLVENMPMAELNSFKRGNSSNAILQKLGAYSNFAEGIDYLIEAKYLQPYMRTKHVESPDSFYYSADEDLQNATQLDYNKTISALTSLYNAARNKDIKMRYGYQLVRFNHYTGNYDRSEAAFKTYVEPLKSKSAPYFLALDQLGGAQRGLGNGKEANWNFFKVFMNSKSRKESAFVSMKLSDTASFNNILARAQSPEEKNMAYFLLAYEDFTNPIPMMEKMYDIDPNSEILKVLAARSVNELERNYLPTFYSPADPKEVKDKSSFQPEKSADKEVVAKKEEVGFWQKIVNFFKNIFKSDAPKSGERKSSANDDELLANPDRIPFFTENSDLYYDSPNKNFLNDFEDLTYKIKDKSDDEFWKITSAYLLFLKKDYEKSSEILSEIKTTNPEYIAQIDRMKMLNEIVSQPKIDGDFENKLYQKYAAFFNAPKKETEGYYGDEPDTKGFIQDILANRYFLQGEDGKAFLMNNELSDLQYNPNSKLVKKVDEFYQKANKNDFEKYIAKNMESVNNPKAFFNVLYGDFAMRQAKFNDAKNYYQQGSSFTGIPRIQYDYTEQGGSTESPQQFNSNEYDGFHNISSLIFGHNVWESYNSPESESMAAENMSDFSFIKSNMTKFDLADAIVQLDQISKGKDLKAAKASQLIGNLLYNTSVLGYYRQAFVMDLDNSNGGKYYFGETDNNFQYYYKNFSYKSFIEPDNFDLAINYYKKALNLNSNKEDKARILFQMASAQQGKYYQLEADNRKTFDYGDEDYEAKTNAEEERLNNIKNSVYRTAFATLKSDYSDTKTVQDLRSSCVYFEYYLNK